MTGLLRLVTFSWFGPRKKSGTSSSVTHPTLSVLPPLLQSSVSYYPPSVIAQGRLVPPLFDGSATLYPPTIGFTPYISPPLLASMPVLFPPTVNQTIRVPLLSTSPAIFAPTVYAGATPLSPPLLSAATAIYAPSIGTTIKPGLLNAATSFYSPTVYSGTTIAPPVLNASATIYAPQVNQAIHAPLLNASTNLFPPTVAEGVILRPNLFATSAAFYPPQIVQLLKPSLLNAGATIYTPKINTTVTVPLLTTAITFYPPQIVLAGSFAVTTPIIDTSVAIAGDNPPPFDVDTVDANGAQNGDTLRLRYKVNGGSYTTVDEVLDEGELLPPYSELFPEFTGFAIGDVVKWNVCVVRAGTQVSNWSSEATWTIQDGVPAAFSFTAQTGAAQSTLTASNSITPSGYSAMTRISIANGEYSINGGSWVSTAGVISPGQAVAVRTTSADTPNTDRRVTLTIGSVSGTFTVTTAGTGFHPAQLFVDGTYGYAFDASDTTRLYQNIDGTVAPADAQPVGRLDDISGFARHFAALSNNTSRPTYNAANGTIAFDGSNDVLKRDDAGLYAGGACTIIMAMSAPPGNGTTNRVSWSERAASGTGRYEPGTGVQNSNNQGGRLHVVNDAGTTVKDSTFGSATGARNSTLQVVTWADDGSSVSITVNRGASASLAYTRSGALTLNRSSLGGMFTTSGLNYDALTFGRGVFIARALTAQERADAEAWCAQPYGIALP